MKRVVPALFVATGLGLGGYVLASMEEEGGFASAGTSLDFIRDRLGDPYELSELTYFRKTASKINGDYVDPRRVDPEKMARSALDGVARLVPRFLYTYDADRGLLELTYGSDSEEVVVSSLDNVPDIAETMKQTAAFLDARLPDDFDRPTVEYALMNGMLYTLDPHTAFITPDDYSEMRITNQGHFGGLGITIGLRSSRLTILYPMSGTPAYRAGLQAGDRIDKIEEESTVNMTLQEAVAKLRGPIGTDVTITVSSDGEMDREVTITRAKISVPSLKHAYAGDGVGYIELSSFAQETHEKLAEALEELGDTAVEDGREQLTGLIVDLRGNPGGYLAQAVQITDQFISDGVIVSTAGPGGAKRKSEKARRFYTEDDVPLVLLVDESSASASEIVAGALKNHDRAVVMGARTFGKGSVQNLYDNDFHGGALKLTVSKYLTPGDVSIQGIGVQPHIALRPVRVASGDDGNDVRMFWQDYETREGDVDRSFDWGSRIEDLPALEYLYDCEECWKAVSRDRDREEQASDNLTEVEVQAAKALLLGAGDAAASKMLAKAERVLDGFFAEREASMAEALADVGVDWTAGQRDGAPVLDEGVRARLEVRAEGGVLVPGTGTPVAVTVTNDSDIPIHRLRAVAEGDFLHGREFAFGKVGPGEAKTFEVTTWPALWLHSRTEEVTWKFHAQSGPVPPDLVGRLRITEVPHPRFALAYQVIDDGSGDSEGNGDGLLQPGEKIDLLVTVENIGDGATADMWKAERGLLDEQDDADGDGKADDPSAFVRLRNGSGDALFIEKGSGWFGLAPGEQVTRRLHFRVAEEVGERSLIEAVLEVQDTRFLEATRVDVALPLHTPSDPVAEMDRTVAPTKGYAVVRTGSSPGSPVVGRVAGPVRVTGRLSQWYRLDLPWGGAGWVSGETVEVTSAEPTSPELVLAHTPPRVTLFQNPGGSAVVADSLVLRGEVSDDELVQDMFVYVGGRKVAYKALDTSAGAHPFEIPVTLEKGENDIEIHARDAQGLTSRLSLSVYRESATASLDSVPDDAVPR